MDVRQITATGTEALNLATALLQRARLADPFAGVFEAADLQWCWRMPRETDSLGKTFWLDDDGPVAGVLLTSFTEARWQIDPVIVPRNEVIDSRTVWDNVMASVANYPRIGFDIPISTDDAVFSDLAQASGLFAADQDTTGWMNAEDAPKIATFAEGFRIMDRSHRQETLHPMSGRNGESLEERLHQCSLYDPALDLSVEAPDSRVAGYSLYWFDPVTAVGLVEPVRIHDEFQRKGLARTMLTHGIGRLVSMGAERIKVSWETEAAGSLYQSAGFTPQSVTSWYSNQRR